jgi:hypothetical protein
MLPTQLELLPPSFYLRDHSGAHTLCFYDMIPRYPFARTKVVTGTAPLTAAFRFKESRNGIDQRFEVEIFPARLKRRSETVLVFPGAREELVERGVRYLAAQQLAECRLNRQRNVTITFTLAALRQHLTETGHGYKAAEIMEALEILADARLVITGSSDLAICRAKESIFHSLVVRRNPQIVVSLCLHPLASAEIIEQRYFPILHTEIMRMPQPFVRWLATRIINRGRGFSRPININDPGNVYSLRLSTIIEELGLSRRTHLRKQLAVVRAARKILIEAGFLSPMQKDPWEERRYSYGRGRPVLTEVCYKFVPSRRLIEHILDGNAYMVRAKRGEIDPKGSLVLRETRTKVQKDRGNADESPTPPLLQRF